MEALFLAILNMSAAASWLILAAAVLRLALRRSPKWVNCLLWGFAGVRLVCPISIESAVSLVPKEMGSIRLENVPTELSFVPVGGNASPALPESGIANVNPLHSWLTLAEAVWLLGVGVMLLYAAVSYLRVKRTVRISIRTEKNIRLCDDIGSPFILGILRPTIYLPSNLKQTDAVIAHENAHIARGDHLWKPLGFTILTVHWFNPLCWLAYILLCRDIELACDEKVVRDLKLSDKKAYSGALLECGIRSRPVSACPLAFGEVGVKQRVKSVLRYRKPAAWVTAVSLLLCTVLACCFLTDPIQAEEAMAAPGEQAFYTVSRSANLREQPSASGKVLSTLPEGAIVHVHRTQTAEGRDWSYVTFEAGDVSGWVVSELLGDRVSSEAAMLAQQQKVPSIGSVITVTAPAGLKSAPAEAGRTIVTLEPGENLTVMRLEYVADRAWLYVMSEQQSAFGWVLLERLSGEMTGATPAEQQNIPQVGTNWMLLSDAALKRSPSEASGKLCTLAAGSELTVTALEYVGDTAWLCVLSDVQGDTVIGWIPSEQLSQITEEANPFKAMPNDIVIGMTFPIPSSVALSSIPTEGAASAGTIQAGTVATVEGSRRIGERNWYCLRTMDASGWAADVPDIEAMAFFCNYALAQWQPTPDAAEQYIGFPSDGERQEFRQQYAPCTQSWMLSGFTRLHESLWIICIEEQPVGLESYQFIGNVGGRLYVFPTLEQLPDELTEKLDRSLLPA